MNNLVNWPDFRRTFESIYPNTIRDALDNHLTAKVLFLGHAFEIRPLKDRDDFEIWGPAAETLINFESEPVPLFPIFIS